MNILKANNTVSQYMKETHPISTGIYLKLQYSQRDFVRRSAVVQEGEKN